jgi:hypothetical protein
MPATNLVPSDYGFTIILTCDTEKKFEGIVRFDGENGTASHVSYVSVSELKTSLIQDQCLFLLKMYF